MYYSTTVGIDTHEKTNSVCAIDTKTGEVIEDKLSSEPTKLIDWIKTKDFSKPICCCYEAGCTGFGLARALNEAGIKCIVAATSKLPKRIDKKSNDPIDAQWLSRMLLAGSVREVYIPSPEQEAFCNLSRLRGEIASDLRKAKQRVVSFMLKNKISYTLTKKKWTKTFFRWAPNCELSSDLNKIVFSNRVTHVLRLQERLHTVETQIISAIEKRVELKDLMSRFLCIHGIGKVTAFSLICEVYDFKRFRCASAFASYLGLVPSEKSSGKKIAHGKITKTGNSHLRRLLIEVASVYSKPIKTIKTQDLTVPEHIRLKAEKCLNRLQYKRLQLKKRNIKANKAKVAIARELSMWIYYIAIEPI